MGMVTNEPRSGKRDSNSRHSAWKADALPTELFPHQNQLPKENQFKSNHGGSWIRTNVGVSQRVYSPPPLATRASHRVETSALTHSLNPDNIKQPGQDACLFMRIGVICQEPTPPIFEAGGGTRTRDLLITNQLLYQLSYASAFLHHPDPTCTVETVKYPVGPRRTMDISEACGHVKPDLAHYCTFRPVHPC